MEPLIAEDSLRRAMGSSALLAQDDIYLEQSWRKGESILLSLMLGKGSSCARPIPRWRRHGYAISTLSTINTVSICGERCNIILAYLATPWPCDRLHPFHSLNMIARMLSDGENATKGLLPVCLCSSRRQVGLRGVLVSHSCTALVLSVVL